MFEVIPMDGKTDFLDEIEARKGQKAYFCRLVGYDDEAQFVMRLAKLYAYAAKNGLFLKGAVANPSEHEVQAFYSRVNSAYLYDSEHVMMDLRRQLPGIEQKNAALLCEALLELFAFLKQSGVAAAVLKNAYIKFLCWFAGVFNKVVYHVGEAPLPLILFQGEIGKYELYVLRILSRAGCDVFYLNYFSDESYLKTDTRSAFSYPIYGRCRKEPQKDFRQVDLSAYEKTQELQRRLLQVHCTVETNAWLSEPCLEALEKSNEMRGGYGQKICNMFVRYIGVDDKELYHNRLFMLKENLAKGGRPYALVTERIHNPDTREVAQLAKTENFSQEELALALAAQLKTPADETVNALLRLAFISALKAEEGSATRVYNFGVQMLCWLNRYAKQLFEGANIARLPVFIYYGTCSARECDFLCILARSGVDVIVILPDKSGDSVFAQSQSAAFSIIEELPQSMAAEPFPETERKVRVATTAYNAERELDQMLYTGTGLFRNRQFARSKPVTLKTTYEEILLLWKEPAKFRPFFDTEQGPVVVPNIFAKICGVKDGNLTQYFNTIRTLLTDDTILVKGIPWLPDGRENPVRSRVHAFLKDGKILPEVIKDDAAYRYDHLKEDTQDYMLEKMQELLDLDWIQTKRGNLEQEILAALLHLDKPILQLIQNFDFTGDIPKIVIIDTNEAMFSLEDCILISFMNLIGFDIAVFTPTGYRNLEKYIKRDAYEEYTIGEFEFNVAIPNLKPLRTSDPASGLFGKLFGKGRN